jgi:hypothetical protein
LENDKINNEKLSYIFENSEFDKKGKKKTHQRKQKLFNLNKAFKDPQFQ